MSSNRLHGACISNEVDTVREFLLRLDGAASREASLLSAHDENGFTPLHLAAGMNCVEIVNLIAAHVKDNPNTGQKHPLNFVGPDGYSAAHFAAAKNNDRIIYLLGKHGSNIDYKNDNGETPLYIAAKFGHSAALNTLLQLNARVNEPNKDGETPAFVASANGNFLIINRLVQHKDVDIDRAQTLGATPLLIASQNGNVNIVRALLEAGAQVDVPKHDDNSTALIMAAQEGHTNICELLLEHKASSRKENSFHSTALCVAAASGHADIVRMLLAKGGANPNHQENGGVTPMHLACEAGFVEVLQTLLEHGGEYEKKRLDGRTCLEIAVIHNQLSCLKHIMETVSNDLARKYGATPKKKKNTLPGYLNSLVATDGVTVLLSCIQHFDIEIARYLVYRGKVDVTQKNSITGEMPITFAAEQNKIAVVDLLIKEAKLKGDSIVNSARKSGSTALHIACTHGHLKLVEYLLGVEEIDINRQSAIGMTPLMEAAKGRHGKIVKVLASNPACNMNIVSSIGLSALHCSVVAQDIASVEAILRSKKGKIMPKKSGTNCLHSSCERGLQNIVQLLLSVATDEDVNKVDKNGDTPLFLAIRHGHHRVVEMLTSDGSEEKHAASSLDFINSSGESALSLAAKIGQHGMVSRLVECGASCMEATQWGADPVQAAFNNGHHGIAEMLEKVLERERTKFRIAECETDQHSRRPSSVCLLL